MAKIKVCSDCGIEYTGTWKPLLCSLCYFWSRYDKSGGPDACWIWQGAVDHKTGYGAITRKIDGIHTNPHRHAYRLHHGVDPGDLFVCHHCDTPLCGNPRHLFLGTQIDNWMDAVNKGRPMMAAPGEGNHNAKLSEDLVRLIRATAGNTRNLARRLGVSRQTILQVRRRRAWRHVADDDVPMAAE